MLKGRSRNPQASQVVQEAILCKLFHCRPSELEEEDYEKIVLFQEVYQYIAEKNPMNLFM